MCGGLGGGSWSRVPSAPPANDADTQRHFNVTEAGQADADACREIGRIDAGGARQMQTLE